MYAEAVVAAMDAAPDAPEGSAVAYSPQLRFVSNTEPLNTLSPLTLILSYVVEPEPLPSR